VRYGKLKSMSTKGRKNVLVSKRTIVLFVVSVRFEYMKTDLETGQRKLD
jgi:hypothetical protein